MRTSVAAMAMHVPMVMTVAHHVVAPVMTASHVVPAMVPMTAHAVVPISPDLDDL